MVVIFLILIIVSNYLGFTLGYKAAICDPDTEVKIQCNEIEGEGDE